MSVLGNIDARLLGLGIVLLVTGSLVIAAWYLVRRRGVSRLLEAAKEEVAALKTRARREAEELEAAARREAESTRREARVEAKEQVLQARQDLEEDSRARRKELDDLEQRLTRREEKLERRTTTFEERERKLSSLEDELRRRERQVEAKEEEAARKREEATRRLEEVAGQTAEEARGSLVELIEKEAREQAAKTVRRVEQEAEARAEREATRIIATAIQRCASDHVAENTVSVVELPSDDMKGRIIGREGRNIRAFEMITGVNLIVDDTPETVLISTFDPLRREIARLALVRLVDDGRIHPARIEEVVEKVRDEIDEQVREEGLDAAAEVGIHDLAGELVRLLGMLKYRTSYGQNVLRHSLEVSTIAGILAAELGVDEQVARRAGLLHDIGKAIDHEVEGTHLQIGMDLLRRFGESEEVIQGMEAHHYDVEPATVEAVLVQAADALSAARPGARRDMLESYVKRLEKLEELADSFNGVTKAYAIQAGRELRIIVESGKVSDDEAVWLSKDLAKRIQREVQYPGEIKVTVIRETRAVEYAR